MKCKVQSRHLRCDSISQYLRTNVFLQLLLQIARVQCESTFADDFYTAGVVEFRPTMSAGMSSSDLLAENLKSYVEVIQSQDAKDTDIIVFPEGTLNNDLQLTYVPAEQDLITPCLDNSKVASLYANFLVELSCAARRVSKYLVINVSEKENCPAKLNNDPRPCASNGINVYNTNVVFDREGRVVSRYRKVHVYVENKNTTFKPEYGIFNTDFGVTFGHFICFDILFYTPAQELVDRYGITDFIFTSLFYSELPFLTATQLQYGWSWGNNVNLLAAGASYPQSGTTGTGIYAGAGGALISVMAKGEGERKLYKARIRKISKANKHNKPQADAQENFKQFIELNAKLVNQTLVAKSHHLSGISLLKDPQIHNYNSVLLDLKQSSDYHKDLCYQDLCCSFDIVVDVIQTSNLTTHYSYRIGVFDGKRSYQKEAWSDIKVCALYACAGDDIESCGESLKMENNQKPVVFRKIHINGTFPKTPKLLIMPTTIDFELNPLPKEQVQWLQKNLSSSYEMDITLTKEHDNLMTFGIYAMYYDKSEGSLQSTSKMMGVSTIVFVMVIEIIKIFT